MAQSLTRIYLQVLLILLLCLAAAGYAGYLVTQDILQSSYQENAAQTARAATDRISKLLTEQRQMVEKFAHQSGMANMLESNSSSAQDRKEDEIKSMLPGAILVRLLPRNSTGTIIHDNTLDPVCLDFVHRAAGANNPIEPEFHAMSTPSMHYDMAATVRDEDQKPVGYLLVSFAPAALQASIEQSLPPGGHMELQQLVTGQPAQAVLAMGEVSMAHPLTVTSTLGNGRWTLIIRCLDESASRVEDV